MIEIIVLGLLAVTNIALLVFLFLNNKQTQKEREKFINALVSRNATEMRDLELTAKVEPIVMPEIPDMTALSDLDDTEFTKAVLGDEDGSS